MKTTHATIRIKDGDAHLNVTIDVTKETQLKEMFDKIVGDTEKYLSDGQRLESIFFFESEEIQ